MNKHTKLAIAAMIDRLDFELDPGVFADGMKEAHERAWEAHDHLGAPKPNEKFDPAQVNEVEVLYAIRELVASKIEPLVFGLFPKKS